MTKINKITRATVLLIIIGGIMGCGIGYNKTLFLTKSNVGLDASVAPKPTLDLAISRFEGVISPGFEKGKKLPVLASFRFKQNDTLALEVGSTYATGDAAIALASLYDDETDGDNAKARLDIVNKENKYDSSLELDKEPKIRKGFLEQSLPSIFPPQEFQTEFVEPVIFGTDSSLGLKIAWSTAPAPPAPFPDSVKFGYNRTEIGLSPVTMEKKNSQVSMKMASLLGTVDSGVTISTSDEEVDLDYLQYFATGKAATLMALQENVRKAMLERLDPHVKYYAGRFSESVKGRARTAFISTLVQIQTVLKNTDEQKAKQLADRMDSVESLVPETYEFTQYLWNPIPNAPPGQPKHELKLIPTPPDPPPTTKGTKLTKAVSYWNALHSSINSIELAGASTEPFIYLGRIASPQDRANLVIPYNKIKQMSKEFDQRLLTHPDIVAALQYLSELLR